VPETGASLVREGVRLSFETDAYPGRSFEAVVSSVSPVLDSSSRTLIAEARVPNSEGLLKPGMFAKIEVVLDESSPAVLVPRQSILTFAGINKIFVIDPDGIVEERSVELGVELDGKVEVLGEAVTGGEQVAVDQLELLKPGMTVRANAGA
jgi:membrane fusion protein (multidrug efflux system)